MQTLQNENIWFCDCDDTLVSSINTEQQILTPNQIAILCPYMKTHVLHKINQSNVRLLKEKKARGAIIVVWSQGGYKWAEAIVKTLNLEDIVDFCMTKPTGILDDLPAEKWMPKNTWLSPEFNYKNSNNQP